MPLKRLQPWILQHVSRRYRRLTLPRKQALLAQLHGRVLELGPGTGVNFEFLPAEVDWFGAEPNRFMRPYLRGRCWSLASAEQLPYSGESFDCVLASLVLCSVRDPRAVMQEIRRVLRPGGRFYFIEHVAAPAGTRLARLQAIVKPLFYACGDGCHPDRDTAATIRAAFPRHAIDEFILPVPAVGPHIAGWAEK